MALNVIVLHEHVVTQDSSAEQQGAASRTFVQKSTTSRKLNIPEHVSCCDRKSRAACAQSFAPWQQATIEITLLLLVRATYKYYVLRAHPVRGESYNQRNTTGEVATLDYHNTQRAETKKTTENLLSFKTDFCNG